MDVPYSLTRAGVVVEPLPGDDLEAEGVLNPGSGRGPDGELYLLPRLVARGNVSRIGLARVVVEGGIPVGVEREGVVLEPTTGFERGATSSGTEDPRITWIPRLGLHVMTYVGYGPMGPRTALAVSADLREWTRLGPALFGYEPDIGTDLGLYPNKDTVFLPEPVTAPDGRLSYAVLQRPMWDLGEIRAGQGTPLPDGVTDPRQSIWMSFVPVDDVERDIRNLALWRGHRFVAGPEFAFEELKIGGGPAPLEVPEGWLLIHHGVVGELVPGSDQQPNVNYAAGAMILDADRPWEVLARTPEPLLAPETEEERAGIVPNVVFPTAIEEIDGTHWVFYGMADSKIGAARLNRLPASPETPRS